MAEIPALAKLQAEYRGKTRISIMLDTNLIEAFRRIAEQHGTGYQTEINRALWQTLQNPPLTAEVLRQVLREELR